MESLAAQAYRADLMTAEQIRRSLGYSNLCFAKCRSMLDFALC